MAGVNQNQKDGFNWLQSNVVKTTVSAVVVNEVKMTGLVVAINEVKLLVFLLRSLKEQ